MKLVKEHINEKFVEDSDPITDMNIGMVNQIKKMIERLMTQGLKGAGRNFLDKNEWLWICARYKRLDFVKYLIDEKNHDIHYDDDLALRWAVYGEDFEMTKFLLSRGADPLAYSNGVLYLTKHHRDNKIKNLLNKEIAKRNQVNEKFTKDSDPIHDLGIGIKHIFKDLKKKIDSAQRKIGSKYYYFSIHGKKNVDGGDIIRRYSVENERLIVYTWMDDFRKKDGKSVDKEEHIKKVFELVGIFDFLIHEKSNLDGLTESITFKIKPQYITYFEEQLENRNNF